MNFVRNLIIFSGVLAMLTGALLYFTGNQLVHDFVWYIFGFFVLVTALAFYVTRLGISYDEDNFQLYYFGSMGFRMILSIAVIFIYVYLFSENELQFVFNFFVFYFLFTGFEIYSLLANLRPNLKRQDQK
ncbi:hypothetical protein [Pontibacter cellulosilyticus]|uniref:Uncharacterized protein n=1 Tax=Pontibacter cellulosilyticus TaxID=1720253 RepID=A0A923N807_9BACT|nr:hypothetical protein [Pontibacter cellulosilyticus]MBC5993889.1 hypothetical protein [Pontibacter cellulosilyticus]